MLVRDLRKIGENFYRVRMQKGMTREEVAEIADISDRTYADIERGSVNMRIETVLRICGALGITPDDVFIHNDPSDVNYDALLRLETCTEKEKTTAMQLLSVYLDSINK